MSQEKNQDWDNFEADSEVLSDHVSKEYDTEGYEIDKTRTVERLVEGKLAADVRKRLNASDSEPVMVTETQNDFWMSEMTSATDYRMEVKCAGHSKKFERDSAQKNFKALLTWLEETPEPL